MSYKKYDDYSDYNENEQGILCTCYECDRTARIPAEVLRNKTAKDCECGANDWIIDTIDAS